jgi:hypothetical protein
MIKITINYPNLTQKKYVGLADIRMSDDQTEINLWLNEEVIK